MSQSSAAEAFSRATSSLVNHSDVADILSHLMRDCCAVLVGDAVGLTVSTPRGELELLSATSHDATALELFQIQRDSGPCVETIRTAEVVAVTTEAEMCARWPDVGSAISAAGFRSVHAFPLRWHGRVIGGLNLFRAAEGGLDPEAHLLGQAFADVASVVILSTVDLTAEEVAARVRTALEGRVVVERAKGVLGYDQGLDMARAYERLVQLAGERQSTLTATAQRVIEDAQRPR
jgi:GAF domain-containing protein